VIRPEDFSEPTLSSAADSHYERDLRTDELLAQFPELGDARLTELGKEE
jgi:hypothetical protein